MNKENYLNRIGITNSALVITLENLRLLQRQHLLLVPFENLDIHWRRPIVLDVEKFRDKIIGQRRGGFCYELNGLFADLLNELGFPSRIISARVVKQNGELSPEYDHLAILTRIGAAEYLVDVGFGSFTAEPLKLTPDAEQPDPNGIFMIRKFDADYLEVVKKDAEKWQSEYIFKTMTRELPEFVAMCNFHQTSPESHFTRGKICSLMTPSGRKSLTDKKLIITNENEKREIEIDSEEKFDWLLRQEFSIERGF